MPKDEKIVEKPVAAPNAPKNKNFEKIEFQEILNRIAARKSCANIVAKNFNFNDRNIAGVDFSGSDLTGSTFVKCNIRGSNFNGATLNDADFTKADLAVSSFISTVAIGAVFDGANLQGSDLEGFKADLETADTRWSINGDNQL